MENIRHLIEVLKSQVALYTDLLQLMGREKESIVSWAINDTVELNREKEGLLRKERIQEEARNLLLSKISSALGVESITLHELINLTEDKEEKDTLQELGSKLLSLVTTIHAENLSLRMLYATNNRLINDFFTEVGMNNNNSYDMSNVRKVNTYRSLA